jgi:hypothetical protein
VLGYLAKNASRFCGKHAFQALLARNEYFVCSFANQDLGQINSNLRFLIFFPNKH